MKKFHFLFQLLISILCFIMLYRFVDIALVFKAIKDARPIYIFLVFILILPTVFIRAWRWQYILAKKKIKFPLSTLYKVTFIGMALNLILPASAGDIARSYYGWKSHGNKEAMLASAIADKAVALFALCLLGIVCGISIGTYKIVWLILALTFPLGFLLFIPWRFPWMVLSKIFKRLFKKDLNVRQLLDLFQMDFVTLINCILISILGWVTTNLMYYFSCLAFSTNAEIMYIFAIAPLINIMRIIPITVSGLGSADALIVFLYTAMSMAKEESLAASMIINLSLVFIPGLIGAFLMFFLRSRQLVPEHAVIGKRD